MTEIGYALTSEIHSANDMVRHAQQAEAAGFGFALISDHFHPFFIDTAKSVCVERDRRDCTRDDALRLGSGVTCPIIRYHPAIVAQAAATCETMMPGRFFLGVGTGANLNEHVTGDRWPSPAERVAMLEEAVEVIRLLWQGGNVSFQGRYYAVDQARLYSLPDQPPPLIVAASGKKMARLAARIGDGLVGLSARQGLGRYVSGRVFKPNKPRYAQMAVCWAKTVEEARRIAYDWWPLGWCRAR